MSRDGILQLELIDVYGDRLAEKVDISLHHQTLSDHRVVKAQSGAKKIKLLDLHGAPQGLYRIEVDPPSYLPVGRFVNLKASGVTNVQITFPIDPKKVKEIRFPKFQDLPEDAQRVLENSDGVLSFEGKKGEELYNALDEIRRAGFLNIVKKIEATVLGNGRTVLTQIERLKELRGDRFFASVPKDLREETKNSVASGLFNSVDGSLHHPPAEYSPAGSFKTDDRYGNLQLTFFMKGNGETVADIDIDDAAGLGHVFQVLRNWFTGQPTHPYHIHDILVAHQHLDPGYRFVV